MSSDPDDPSSHHHSHLHDWIRLSTEERDLLLEGFCKEGLTASQIALQFINCSRNAVVGRIHRMQGRGVKIRLGGYQPKHSKKSAEPKRKPAKPDLRIVETAKAAAKSYPEVAAQIHAEKKVIDDHSLDALPLITALPSEAISVEISAFLDHLSSSGLTADQKRDLSFTPLPGSNPISDPSRLSCRWPVNGTFGREPLHCGLPSAPLGYCEAHRRIAYTPRNPITKEVRRGANS